MLDNIIAGHRVAPESFRRREIQLFEESATGKYIKKYFFLGEGHMQLYSTFSLLLLVSFLPYCFSFPAHHLFCVFLLVFPFHCLHPLLSWLLLYSANFLSSVLNSQLYICLLPSLHVLFLLLCHSLIFTVGSMLMFADLAVVFILQSISLNLNYRNIPRLLFPYEFQTYLCILGKVTLSTVYVIFPIWTLISLAVLTEQ